MSTRIKPVEADNASKEQNEVLNLINQKFGRIPNIFALMANSPQSIKGYLAFNEALSNGVLSPQIRERIAIVVAETHLCEYCLSAHVALAKQIGLDDAEIMKARQVQSQDAKIDALGNFLAGLWCSLCNINNPLVYANVFLSMAVSAILASIILYLLLPLINKLEK